ncbi:MAG TPA: ankyrin repeat domain-containing protein [Leptospiraceae bacterium]|nr:ankyrin repeat domain-containing protein [Leptospiraceae bacterium]HMX34482.1 ankyrin repeat domain-containing protein [Leptospiraceae bacterium]HMY33748.1 ankyrin repeat domain-containing protein [Leptospiraceae bacterium]HMZ66886.1 ankyrin repeat domain-containing protein [Leptospiraceae bacterium]HNA07807.1 ankyrin repeat domain-containing protein [Leptospiraceae bacterium]
MDKTILEIEKTFRPDYEERDFDGLTSLHIAANEGNSEKVIALLNNGSDINAVTNYWHTPLHYAVNRGGYEIVKILLERGAKVNVLSNFDYTPLHFAANHGKLREASLLIEHGAPLNIQNTFGHTPLHCAVNHTRIFLECDDCVERGKYKYCWGVHGRIEVAKLLIEKGARMHLEDGDGNTPLYLAIKNGYPEVVESIHVKLKIV